MVWRLEKVLQQLDRGRRAVCIGCTSLKILVWVIRARVEVLFTARQDPREPSHPAVVAKRAREHEPGVLQHVDPAQPIGQHMGLSPLLQALSRQRQVSVQVDVDILRGACALTGCVHLHQDISQFRHPERRDRCPHIIRRPEQHHVRGRVARR